MSSRMVTRPLFSSLKRSPTHRHTHELSRWLVLSYLNSTILSVFNCLSGTFFYYTKFFAIGRYSNRMIFISENKSTKQKFNSFFFSHANYVIHTLILSLPLARLLSHSSYFFLFIIRLCFYGMEALCCVCIHIACGTTTSSNVTKMISMNQADDCEKQQKTKLRWSLIHRRTAVSAMNMCIWVGEMRCSFHCPSLSLSLFFSFCCCW